MQNFKSFGALLNFGLLCKIGILKWLVGGEISLKKFEKNVPIIKRSEKRQRPVSKDMNKFGRGQVSLSLNKIGRDVGKSIFKESV